VGYTSRVPHHRGRGPRLSVACLIVLVLPAGVSASGNREPAVPDSLARPAPSRVFDVRWYNVSAAPLVPVDKDPVSQAIQKRFNVKLTLLGGPPGSGGYLKLVRDIESNGKLGPNDARRKALPDVFPWSASLGGTPPLTELFAPLPVDLIRRNMPRTWTGIQVIALKEGMSPDAAWAPFMSNGVPYAIPRPNPGWMFPAGVIWRADVLEKLGRGVPSTVEEWESVFRAYRQSYPTRIPWTAVQTSLPFQPLFEASGQELSGFIEKDGRVQPGIVQPQMRVVLQTLRRWYANRYIATIDFNGAYGITDTNSLFIGGRNIVSAEVRPEDGSWVCEEPYLVGSIQDLTARRVPGASFVMAPRPVFEGVARAAGGARVPPFGALCFGFSKELAGQPEKLERLMGVVDALAGDSRMYLTAAFGIEGSQWAWQRTSDGRYPRRLASGPAANTGQYWIFPWSANETELSLTPRVLGSITRFYGTPTSLYGAGSAAPRLFSIPYADTGTRTQEEKARFERLFAQIWSRFHEQVLSPVLSGNADIGVFDTFVSWYHENGGDDLERIVTRWAGR